MALLVPVAFGPNSALLPLGPITALLRERDVGAPD